MNKKICLFLSLIVLSPLSIAASVTGKVEMLMTGPHYSGVVFVKVNTLVANKPSCSNNSTWDFSFNGNDESGKTLYSLLLSSYAAGKTVSLYGLSECSHWSTVEDLSYAIAR
jgi:hypothetical protein